MKPPRGKGRLTLPRLAGSDAFTLIELIVVIAIIGIILAVAVPYYQSYKRSACDDAATADLAKLGAAYEKFRTELSDRNCGLPSDLGAWWTNARIASFSGPYYGWAGTNDKCDVRVRYSATDQVFEAGAVRGAQPNKDATRFIFQITAAGTVKNSTDAATGKLFTADVSSWQSVQYSGSLSSSMLGTTCP